jgi:hypothetical protein
MITFTPSRKGRYIKKTLLMISILLLKCRNTLLSIARLSVSTVVCKEQKKEMFGAMTLFQKHIILLLLGRKNICTLGFMKQK